MVSAHTSEKGKADVSEPLMLLISNALTVFTAAAQRKMIRFMQTLQHAPLSYCASLCQISLFFAPLQAFSWR